MAMKYILKTKAVTENNKKKVHRLEASRYKKNKYPTIISDATRLGMMNVVP